MAGVDRLERLDALLRRVIGEAMFHVLAGEEIDPGAITVTQVRVARNLRNATVLVSIFGHDKERGTYLHKIASKAKEFQRIINSDMKMKYTPQLYFTLDESLEKGDHILDVLAHLDDGKPAAPADSQQ
jgi:ribosome-binding factor A